MTASDQFGFNRLLSYYYFSQDIGLETCASLLILNCTNCLFFLDNTIQYHFVYWQDYESVQKHFWKKHLCPHQGFLCALISRPVRARTSAQLRGKLRDSATFLVTFSASNCFCAINSCRPHQLYVPDFLRRHNTADVLTKTP